MYVRKNLFKALGVFMALAMLLALLPGSSVLAEPATPTHVFGPAYAEPTGLTVSTDEAFSGDGSWYHQHGDKVSLYFDPVVSFGESFTIDQIESLTYHTLNNADNPSDVDFYMVIYTLNNENCTDPDASWYCRRLIAEPLYNREYVPPTAGEWNIFTTDMGDNQLTFNDTLRSGNQGFYNQPTLQDIQVGEILWSDLISSGSTTPVDYRDEVVRWISFQTGSGWSAFAGYLDAIKIELNTGEAFFIDLEADTSPLYVSNAWADSLLGEEVEAGKYFGWNAFDTIQAAIDVAEDGDTIEVGAGTYVEVGQIVIDKDLTIIGADKETTIIKPAQNTGSSGDARGWILVNAGVEFNLSNVSLDGEGKQIFQAIRSNGTGTIENNIITNMQHSKYFGYGIAIFDNMVISNNHFSNIARVGISVFGTGVTDALITGNTYIGRGPGDFIDYGIEVGSGATGVTIQDNTITGVGDSTTDWQSAAIVVTDAFPQNGPPEVLIENNNLSGNHYGIFVGYGENDGSVVTAKLNNLSDTYRAVTTAPAGILIPVDASPNWFGSIFGPSDTQIRGDVEFTPWCGDAECRFFMPDEEVVLEGTINETIVINNPGLTIFLKDGTDIDAGGPCFEIYADDTTIYTESPGGAVCYPGSHGVVVGDGVDSFELIGLRIDGTGMSDGNGVHFEGTVSNVWLVDNFIHDIQGGSQQEFTSAALNFSTGGWAGWSCPTGMEIVSGYMSYDADGELNAEDDFQVSQPAKPGIGTYPVYPHYTYTPPETGWVAQTEPDKSGTYYVQLNCGDVTTGHGVFFADGLGGVNNYIQGNLFLDNAGNGIEAGTAAINAQYNSWGHVDGADAGDGASENVDWANWTHVDLYLESSGTVYADQVVIGETITFTIYGSLANVSGVEIELTHAPEPLGFVDFEYNENLFDVAGHEAFPYKVSMYGYQWDADGEDPVDGIYVKDTWLFRVTFSGDQLTKVASAGFYGLNNFAFAHTQPDGGPTNHIYPTALLGVDPIEVIDLPVLSQSGLEFDFIAGISQEFTVTLDNPAEGGEFDQVLFHYRVLDTDMDDIFAFEYWDAVNGIWKAMPMSQDGDDVVGFYGPQPGFPLSAPYEATTLFRITFMYPGEYNVVMTLDDTLMDWELARLEETVTVLGDFTVTATVSMQGRTVRSGVPMTLTIFTLPEYGPFEEVSGTAMVGNLVFTGVNAGSYEVTTAQPRYLNLFEGMGATFDLAGDVTLPPLHLRGGDLTGSNSVGIGDASIVGNNYGETGVENPGDANFDGIVNIFDLAMVGGNFGLTSEVAYADWVASLPALP